ncbi:MAG TPA: hypothetical protein VGK61_10340 [Planctomycetota bacterium]
MIRKLALTAMAVMIAATLAGCSTAGGGAAVKKCSACGTEVKVLCSVDRKCRACDTCVGTCAGCGAEAKLMSLCSRDKLCPSCDTCAR